jgi:hypothetical protein
MGLVLEAGTLTSGNHPIGFRNGLVTVKSRLTSHQAPGLRPRQLARVHALADALSLMVFTLVQPGSVSK